MKWIISIIIIIFLSGCREGEEAIQEADLIRVIIPAVGHAWAADKLAPYLGRLKKQKVK